MPVRSLQDLYLQELGVLDESEHQILQASLGFQKAAELVQQTLIEETETDRVLTQIAETMVEEV